MSDSLQPYGLYPARLLCLWNSPSKNTGVGSYSLLQQIFPAQGLNPGLLHCRQTLYHPNNQRSPKLKCQFSTVQLLSCVRLFVTPRTAAHQASLSITNSRHLLRLMYTESVMPSNHLILCRPLLFPPSIFPSTRVFSNESDLCIRWPKYWSFSISASNEYPGLISFRIDGLALLAVQGALRVFSNTTVQKHQFFSVQLSIQSNSHQTIALTRQTFVGKVMSMLFNMLPRLIIAFLPRSKCLLISWLQSPSAVILEPKKIKSVTGFLSLCHEVMGLDAMILVF